MASESKGSARYWISCEPGDGRQQRTILLQRLSKRQPSFGLCLSRIAVPHDRRQQSRKNPRVPARQRRRVARQSCQDRRKVVRIPYIRRDIRSQRGDGGLVPFVVERARHRGQHRDAEDVACRGDRIRFVLRDCGAEYGCRGEL